jgi:regulatory protein
MVSNFIWATFNMERKKKSLDAPTALLKMQHYCAYQERSHSEVRSKLIELGIYGEILEDIVASLISDNFLNEERFAKSFAHGKFNIKKWGKIRIKQELKLRKISAYSIKKALEEIKDDEYEKTLREIINKKNALINETDDFKRQQKLFQYALQKGYEIELIQKALVQ